MNGSISKRGERSWKLTIDLGRGPEGRRRRKFVTVKGTKADGHRKLREVLSSLDKELPVDISRRLTLRELMGRWLQDYALPSCSPRTVVRYESDIRLHLSLSPFDIQILEANCRQGEVGEVR